MNEATATSPSVANSKVIGFHYRMCKVNPDGSKGPWLEDNFNHQPSTYLHGHNNLLPGLEAALLGKQVGDEVSTTLAPEQGFGPRRENATQRVPVKHLQADKKQKLTPGSLVNVQTQHGVRQAVVVKSGKFNVDLDFNHPLAGFTLHYQVKIATIRDALPEELSHGHVHGPGGHHH